MSNKLLKWEPGQTLPDEFLSLPHQLYRQDSYWLPENTVETARAFSKQNPYFERSKALVWLVPGKVRLAGFYDPDLQINGEQVAFFGYWETAPDTDLNREVFSHFEKWASRQGATTVYGPINFTTYGAYRIRLNLQPGEGCFPGEPYNPPYYQAILENCGYTLYTLYQSQYISEDKVNQVYAQKEQVRTQIPQTSFQIIHWQPELWMERLPEMYHLIDHTFRNNFAYTPISYQTFSRLYGEGFARRMCPHMSIAVVNEQEQIIGFTICFPDYAPLYCNGAANPVKAAELSYTQHFPLLTSPTLLIKTLGVHPSYRQSGVMNTMGYYLMTQFRKHYTRAMACLMKSDNYSTYFFKDVGAAIREYGLYSKKLA